MTKKIKERRFQAYGQGTINGETRHGLVLINEHGIRVAWGKKAVDLPRSDIESVSASQYTTGSVAATLAFGVLGLAASVKRGQLFVKLVSGQFAGYEVKGYTSTELVSVLSSFGYPVV